MGPIDMQFAVQIYLAGVRGRVQDFVDLDVLWKDIEKAIVSGQKRYEHRFEWTMEASDDGSGLTDHYRLCQDVAMYLRYHGYRVNLPYPQFSGETRRSVTVMFVSGWHSEFERTMLLNKELAS